VHRIGRAVGGWGAAWAAWLLASLYGPSLFYEGELLEVACATFLVLCGMTALVSAEPGPGVHPAARWVLGGAALSGAALLRPEQAAAIPFAAAALSLSPGAGASRVRRAALVAAGAAAMLLPLAAPGLFLPVRANHTGINTAGAFYLGNHERADGQRSIYPEAGEFPTTDPEARAGHMTGLDLTTIRVARAATGGDLETVAPFWRARAWEAIASDPGHAAMLTGRKAILFTNAFLLTTQKDLYVARDFSRLLSWLIWSGPLLLPLGIVLPLAAAGVAARFGWREAVLLSVPAGCLVSTLLFTHDARFQHPAVLASLPLAGRGAVVLAAALRARTLRPAIAALAALLWCNADLPGTHQVPVAHEYFRIGVMHRERGEMREAARAWLRSIAADPEGAPALDSLAGACRALPACDEEVAVLQSLRQAGAHGFDLLYTLADLLDVAGRPREADPIAEEAARFAPRRPEGHLLSARIAREIGGPEAAVARLSEGARLLPADASLRLELARSLINLSRPAEALDATRAVLSRTTSEPEAYAAAGMALLMLGRHDEAAAVLADGRALHPGSVPILGTLAQARAAQGRLREAEASYRALLELEPKHPEALYRLARLLRDEGRLDEARPLASRARDAGHPLAAPLLDEMEGNRPVRGRVQPGREETQ